MILYKFLSLKKGTPAHKGAYWDFALLNDILTDPRFKEVDTLDDGGIIIFPARAQADKVAELNEYIKPLKWVILCLMGDEEVAFPVEEVQHENIRIYVMSPKQGKHDNYRFLPNGYTPHTRPNLKLVDKDLDYFFAGQITHPRREQCVEALENMSNKNGKVLKTKGFTQGFEPSEYIDGLNRAKIAPCPSGPVICDSFRVYEALEAGCIPIADNISATDKNYWHYLFPDAPFPTINDYSDLPGYIEDQLDGFQARANRIQAWWIKKKRDLKYQLIQDVADLTGKHHKEAITVVVPVSPIKSHPSTEILDETIGTIRQHLPNSEILLTFDGVRKEQEHMRDDYEEFIRRALFKANTEWSAVPIIFDEHMHQSGMMKAVIDEIKSPLLMYVEQDTPITPDMPIDFKAISNAILNGGVSHVRLCHESYILEDYKHMMLDAEPISVSGCPIVRTVQYSNRPHVASVAFYRQLLSHFSENSKAFLEDLLHGIIYEAYKIDGMQGWQNYRLAIYHPEGNIKRSYHTDGRAGEEKYDSSQRF